MKRNRDKPLFTEQHDLPDGKTHIEVTRTFDPVTGRKFLGLLQTGSKKSSADLSAINVAFDCKTPEANLLLHDLIAETDFSGLMGRDARDKLFITLSSVEDAFNLYRRVQEEGFIPDDMKLAIAFAAKCKHHGKLRFNDQIDFSENTFLSEMATKIFEAHKRGDIVFYDNPRDSGKTSWGTPLPKGVKEAIMREARAMSSRGGQSF